MSTTKCKNRFCNLWRSNKPMCCAKISPRVEHCPESCRYNEFVAGLTAPSVTNTQHTHIHTHGGNDETGGISRN